MYFITFVEIRTYMSYVKATDTGKENARMCFFLWMFIKAGTNSIIKQMTLNCFLFYLQEKNKSGICCSFSQNFRVPIYCFQQTKHKKKRTFIFGELRCYSVPFLLLVWLAVHILATFIIIFDPCVLLLLKMLSRHLFKKIHPRRTISLRPMTQRRAKLCGIV